MVPHLRKLMLGLAGVLLAGAAPPAVRFEPVVPHCAPAAEEYRRIWSAEGAAMVAALERASGAEFPDAPVTVLVGSPASMASLDGRSIWLKAGYAPDEKRAVLMHELGHRLAFTLGRAAGLDDHRLLFLFLHDAWADLYGRGFADRMVAKDRASEATYDYDAAWTWALGLGRAERQERLRAIAGATTAR